MGRSNAYFTEKSLRLVAQLGDFGLARECPRKERTTDHSMAFLIEQARGRHNSLTPSDSHAFLLTPDSSGLPVTPR